MTIRRREVYQVGKRFYIGKETAARKEAWHRICRKYCADPYGDEGSVPLSDVSWVGNTQCKCYLYGDSTGYSLEEHKDWTDCPLHDRKTGYFARLAKRLARQIEATL